MQWALSDSLSLEEAGVREMERGEGRGEEAQTAGMGGGGCRGGAAAGGPVTVGMVEGQQVGGGNARAAGSRTPWRWGRRGCAGSPACG